MRPLLPILALPAALLGSLLCTLAEAHHSFFALFQMDRFAEVEGRVTRVRWVNPHIIIYVRDEAGETWEAEAGAVNLLSRMGIDRDMIGVGETIRVRGNPARRSERHLWVSNILLGNDTELLAAPGASPRWTSNTVGDTSGFFEIGDVALPAGSEPSFFRIWTPTSVSDMPRPQGPRVLTPEGERAQARYSSGEQVIGDCEMPGMPFAMQSLYPIEIVDRGDRLLIRGEAYDLERVVYLEPPARQPRSSPLGFSVGRFSGDELIIETTDIDYHSYGDLGPAQSELSRLVERFKLHPDGLGLDYEIIISDAIVLAQPWRWSGSYAYSSDAELKAWNCGGR